MTTVVAVKKGKRICLASDSLSLFGSCKEVAGKQTREKGGKWLEIGPNIMGTSGHPSWSLILADVCFHQKPIPAWETPIQIFEFFNAIHEQLKRHYFLTPPTPSFLPLEAIELDALIINPFGIFELEYSRVVRQYSKYSAIGTGEGYALGAMSAVYDRMEHPEAIAKIGVEAAAEFDRKTGLPLHICSIEID